MGSQFEFELYFCNTILKLYSIKQIRKKELLKMLFNTYVTEEKGLVKEYTRLCNNNNVNINLKAYITKSIS